MGLREKLIEVMKDTRANATWHRWGYEESADYLIECGVTIPVRCKDCKKRYKPNECPMCILVYGEQNDFTQENGYCDRGERRTDDRETG